jgi:thiol-disulfide isomerase/thioredoxin
VEGLSVAVKRQVLFFVFAVLVAASYGVVRVAHGENRSPLVRLPALYFYDKSGHKVTLDDFRGKVVLVNLWATWCTPCVAELPSLDRLQKMLPGDKFMVVAISMDNSSLKDIAGFLKKKGVKNLDVYWDKDRQAPLKWQYDGLPTSFLLDRDGNVVKRYDGPEVWDDKTVVKKIKDTVLK